ncbi:hypothetical protein [Deinococcus arcticus]|uniref:Uncharacterized protein n=1 Tax=Deinococcus arcticus TaxID=2136176 RepID=A0A2T3W9J8_9DEIO|nr:hypothetical protein [Deinococcus arcticus]PTA68588.1 hypothetical protein C8263_07285 [Deinococcus arcticus]
MAPQDDAFHITRVRLGLATNSSSSHSLVLLQAPETEDEPQRGQYGRTEFTLITQEARRHFLAAQLMSSVMSLYDFPWTDLEQLRTERFAPSNSPEAQNTLRHVWRQWENVAAAIRELCGLPADTDLLEHTVDHQSAHHFPRAASGWGPDPEAFARYRDLLLTQDVAVFGADDGSEHSRWDEDRHLTLGSTDQTLMEPLRGED